MKETTNLKETTTMKRKLGALLAATVTMAMMAAGPASADDLDGDDLLFSAYPFYSVVDDVDYENVRERNDRDGECRVDDVDLDGVGAEFDLVCYY